MTSIVSLSPEKSKQELAIITIRAVETILKLSALINGLDERDTNSYKVVLISLKALLDSLDLLKLIRGTILTLRQDDLVTFHDQMLHIQNYDTYIQRSLVDILG
jgi:hypothetical protein